MNADLRGRENDEANSRTPSARRIESYDAEDRTRADHLVICEPNNFEQKISVTPEKLLRMQGYRRKSAVPPQVAMAAQTATQIAHSVVKPAAAFRIVDVALGDSGAIRINSNVLFHSRDLGTCLRDAVGAVVFAATIGEDIDRRADALLGEGAHLEWLFLQTAGALAIHLVVSRLRARIATVTRNMGCRVFGRFGPGHGDWPLEDQYRLFSLFPRGSLPVVLNDSGVLEPRNSMTGLCALIPRTDTQA